MRIAAALVLAAMPALAGDDPARYPAAQCAAFWLGWDDYATRSALMDRTPGDLDRAERFRAEAHRLTLDTPAAIDAFIAQQRPLMMRLIDEAIYAPGESRSLMERLLQTCGEAPPASPGP